jgi:hypothetical protein
MNAEIRNLSLEVIGLLDPESLSRKGLQYSQFMAAQFPLKILLFKFYSFFGVTSVGTQGDQIWQEI